VGCFLKTAKPIVLREKWSSTTASHQQSGHTCGSAFGLSIDRKPPRTVGTTVRST
jgi:hypothetical protein